MPSSLESNPRLERPEKKFEAAYKRILNTSVSPENIQTFFDTSLKGLVSLVEEVVAKYEATHPHAYLVRAELEDDALRSYQLPDVQETLEAISARGEMILKLKRLIQAETHLADEVFVPPTPQEWEAIIPGSGKGLEQKRLIPRLLTLLYILENDLGYDLSRESEKPAHITAGTVTDRMVRKTPYFRVIIPDLHRVVYICEEEGNASYIFDSKLLSIPLEQLDTLDKEALNKLIESRPEVGRRLIQTPAWREKMLTYLTQDFTEDESDSRSLQKHRSDFSPIQNVPQKKEGWESANALTVFVRADSSTIKEFSESFREKHPEWFEIQRTGKRMAELYHPELVKKIQEHFTAIPLKKEGWESANKLHTMVNAGYDNIKTFAETFRVEHPEWFEIQKTRGLEVEHYHHDLIAKIQGRFFRVPQKKEGWDSYPLLARNIKASPDTIKVFAELFRLEHPEWFEMQKTSGQEVEHCHPDLIEKIREHFLRFPQKKEGWENASKLQVLVRANSPTIRAFAETFRSEHPEWFETQKATTNMAEHYHPELVKKIEEHFTAIPLKKEGWETISFLRKTLKGGYSAIKTFAESLRTEHPEWFEIQKTRGQGSEHYHPELVERIKERFPRR